MPLLPLASTRPKEDPATLVPEFDIFISGELTFAEGGQETVYKAGDYFFETGNFAHTAHGSG